MIFQHAPALLDSLHEDALIFALTQQPSPAAPPSTDVKPVLQFSPPLFVLNRTQCSSVCIQSSTKLIDQRLMPAQIPIPLPPSPHPPMMQSCDISAADLHPSL